MYRRVHWWSGIPRVLSAHGRAGGAGHPFARTSEGSTWLSTDRPVAPKRANGSLPGLRRRAVREPVPDVASPYDAFRRIQRGKPSSSVGVGVIGYGYWGPNLVRNFAELPAATLVAVSDLSVDRLAQVHTRHPKVKLTTDYHDIIADPCVDAVVVATPVSSHFEVAMTALRAGKHVLVTKPITADREQATQLIDAAEARGLVLMVDHTFVYTGAVQIMKQLVTSGNLGKLYYYDSVRVNLGLFQRDVNVLWDLAVHDLAIMDHVLGRSPVAVAATGAAHVPGHRVNLAYLTCYFDGRLITHHHVNWLAPLKIRRTLIGGSRQMIVYDDLEPSEKIKVYDKGITIPGDAQGKLESMIGYRTGDMWAPQVSLTEGLRVEAEHFLECVTHGRQPLTDGHCGLRMVSILEAAAQSLTHLGRPVEVASSEGAAAGAARVGLEVMPRTA
jgi:predicted dehydrogenase